MKKEFGKWLMDIAKYMATALTLIFGLLLIRDKKEKEEV